MLENGTMRSDKFWTIRGIVHQISILYKWCPPTSKKRSKVYVIELKVKTLPFLVRLLGVYFKGSNTVKDRWKWSKWISHLFLEKLEVCNTLLEIIPICTALPVIQGSKITKYEYKQFLHEIFFVVIIIFGAWYINKMVFQFILRAYVADIFVWRHI